MSKPHRRITMGVEIEAYTILTPEYEVSRRLAFPRKGVAEAGERFTRDASIGSEYNTPPFQTVREGLFLLKAGLRKYNRSLYRTKSRSRKGKRLLLVGGWSNRFAGTHIHLSPTNESFTPATAKRLAGHLHDHIPLLIAMGANSPVWGSRITDVASNRISKASGIYFKPITRSTLTSRDMDELKYSPGRKRKPITLEIRVLDANIPEYAIASTCVVKAVSLSWARGAGASNRLSHRDYLRAREDASLRGMKSRLCWNGRWITAVEYLDRFVWTYRDAFRVMDVPQEIWHTFKLLKKGIDGSILIRNAARAAAEESPRSWPKAFARRYVPAIDALLGGNTILEFMEELGVPAPSLKNIWLGRPKLRLS